MLLLSQHLLADKESALALPVFTLPSHPPTSNAHMIAGLGGFFPPSFYFALHLYRNANTGPLKETNDNIIVIAHFLNPRGLLWSGWKMCLLKCEEVL